MASEVCSVDKTRPNIRVQISNDFVQKMEVEESTKTDNEEGEISDDNTPQKSDPFVQKNGNKPTARVWPTTKTAFTTGINIFDQEKLTERARRFALKPEEVSMFTEDNLENLHASLGINSENKPNVRFEAIHVIGLDGMTTEDVLEYFKNYAPTGIEWVDDDSCNVTWNEEVTAARTLFSSSKTVKGMPVREASRAVIDLLEEEEQKSNEAIGRSILLKNNREIQLTDDDGSILKPKPSVFNINSVDISEITIPIPPGYWRLGEKCLKSACLLLRFAFKTDKKPYKSEKLFKYYKKYGETKRNKGIFDRNKDINTNDKNPWGILAENWDEDKRFREREPVMPIPIVPKEDSDDDVIITKVTKNPNIRNRLGTKRKAEEMESKSSSESEASETESLKKTKFPRMKMYADEEEEKIKRKKILQKIKKQTKKIEDDVIDQNDLRNMLGMTYKRPKLIETPVENPQDDLALRLKNRAAKLVYAVDHHLDHHYAFDHQTEQFLEFIDTRPDARSLLAHHRALSPQLSPLRIRYRSATPPLRRSPTPPPRRRSPIRAIRRRSMERTRIRERSPLYRSKMHSDRMYSDRKLIDRVESDRRHGDDKRYGDDRRHGDGRSSGRMHSDRMDYDRYQRRCRHRRDSGENDHKPKSKVAVVIKRQSKPAVASTIWSRVQKPGDSESSSSSDSESESESSSSNESSTEEESNGSTRRQGFSDIKSRLKMDHRSPLKIEISNDRYRK